ncbi:MAG TPA: lipopolysaccharide assembly protein LapA domain-containing protein [Pseudonocardiaceae bacterium]|nr:lipopolysaccharide assembly protein LapA domain-containing protein [Pseudonocardiaceae bacterium]
MTDQRGSDRPDLAQSDPARSGSAQPSPNQPASTRAGSRPIGSPPSGSAQSGATQATVDNPDTDRFAVQAPPMPTVPEQAGPPQEPAPTPHAAQVNEHYQQVRRTKFSGLWIGITVAAIVLLALLVFIIENSQTVDIGFFGAHWHLSLGVAMLLAAICGILLVAIPGYGRIIQLRRVLRKAAKPTPGQPTPKNPPRQ